MDKAITTGLLIIAGIIASLALINAVIPAVGKSSSALLTANSTASDRIRTDIEVIHVASDLTGVGGEDQILVWVKNIGSNPIAPVSQGDIFLKRPVTGTSRIPYGSGVGTWNYAIEGGFTDWTEGVTVKMTLHLTDASVIAGAYSVTVTVYNSVSAEKDFSL